jgi:hypothetical protein
VPSAPEAQPKPVPNPAIEQAALPREPIPASAVPPPPPAPAPRPVYAPEFEKESAFYCRKQIGRWQESEALELLGDPTRRRAASDDDGSDGGDGHILAFADPTGRYKELELDFNKDTGLLRTVFAYPKDLSWQECRRQWGTKVSSADANNGRTFYSYANHRLDVLVDASGRVISLGMY